MKSFSAVLLAVCSLFPLSSARAANPRDDRPHLPAITTKALDGHNVSLPQDLDRLNVVIVGFTRSSADRTTAWEKSVRREILPAGVPFYDVAILESVPKFMRGVVSGLIRNKVPTVVKPHFLMLFEGQTDWKRAVVFDPHDEDAAYVLITDAQGGILWSTHEAYGDTTFDMLKKELSRRGMRKPASTSGPGKRELERPQRAP